MQGSKRLAVVAAALALGALGATGTAAAGTANTKAASSAAAAPTTITLTAADVANVSAHLPKGAHVKLIPAQRGSTIKPAITTRGCTPGWGVEVWDQNWNCTSYGYTGTTGYLGYYASEALTNNNYGWISFNKDLAQYSGYSTAPCEEFDFYTGTHSTALLQYVHIDGWVNATCGNILDISW